MVSTEKRNRLILIKCLTAHPAAQSVLWVYAHNQNCFIQKYLSYQLIDNWAGIAQYSKC
jgi:hypothetical protein